MRRSRSYSRRRAALYTWNSPDPAPAEEPCTLVTISGGGGSGLRDDAAGGGIRISWSGLEKSADRVAACAEVGDKARRDFLTGRVVKGSVLVGFEVAIFFSFFFFSFFVFLHLIDFRGILLGS
jgi:hypothetical protein